MICPPQGQGHGGLGPWAAAFHYFTEYLAAHDYFSGADAARLQAAAARFYEVVRDAVDANDSAYWICPTYEALIAAPRLLGET